MPATISKIIKKYPKITKIAVLILIITAPSCSKKYVSSFPSTFPFDEDGNYRQDWVLLREKKPKKYSISKFTKATQKSKKQLKREQKLAEKKAKEERKRQEKLAKQRAKEYKIRQKQLAKQREAQEERQKRIALIERRRAIQQRQLEIEERQQQTVRSNNEQSRRFIVASRERQNNNQNQESYQEYGTLKVLDEQTKNTERQRQLERERQLAKERERKARELAKAKAKAEAEKRASSPSSHTVRKGDTLWAISQKYKIPIDKIRKLNSLDNNLIKIGQVLALK